MTTNLLHYAEQLGRQARQASRLLATVPTRKKNDWLRLAADSLLEQSDALMEQNQKDLELADRHELTGAQKDRLRLTSSRVEAMASGLRDVAQLPDPVGQILQTTQRPNGLEIAKVGVPLGVIFFIYESRPNVTVDAASLAIKSGNAIILRGGKEALHSNLALYRVLRDCLQQADVPPDGVQMVEVTDRDLVGHFLKLNEYIDLAVPRGGASLIRRVAEEATMPVIKHFDGNCHIYVDQAANPDWATNIIINAKCQRPGVCNAVESLLVHGDIAEAYLPKVASALSERGVTLRGCEETCRILPDIEQATEEDYRTEYLDLILSVKVVSDVEAAIEHINNYGSHHTDAVVTNDIDTAKRFTTAVDSAAVMVNASTRFHDGYEFGLGAEIGISTDKFHARGPCGLLELCSYKYVVHGAGQVRE